MTDLKASLARRDDDSPRESGVYLRTSGDGIQAVPPRNAAADIVELQNLLRRLCDQVSEVQHLRGRMPTLPPRLVDNDGVRFAEVGLSSLRRSG
jgi:hypothetical protein